MSLIRFIFSGDTSELDKAATGAKKQLKQLRDEFRAGVNQNAKWVAAMAAAGAAVSTHLINKSLNAIDAQAKLAKTLDSTVRGLQVTTRAANLSGVAFSGVEQATKDLTRRLSQAADGTGPAVEALQRLNFTAQDLQKLPLDERIATINQAIKDFIPTAQQAAVAGQLFGEEGSLAMQRIDPSTLKAAADEIDRFNLSLSEVDAAQVETANDAMSAVTTTVGGLINKVAVELSPVLTALSNELLDAADASGVFDNFAEQAFDKVTQSAAFVMDAVVGIQRVFVAAGKGVAVFALKVQTEMLKATEFILGGPTRAVNDLIRTINQLPGNVFNIPEFNYPPIVADLRDDLELSKKAVAEGMEDIRNEFSKPLPGGQFLEFVKEAKAAGRASAEALVAAREAAAGEGDGDGSGLGLSDAERDSIATRLEAVRQAGETEIDELRRVFGERQAVLQEAYEAELISKMEHDQRQLEVEQEFQKGMTEIQKEAAEARQRVVDLENKQRMAAVGKALGDLSTLMNSESRKMFEVGKAAAISQTILSTFEGAQKAYTALAGIPVVGPALGAAAAVAAIAAGTARVQAIRSQSFGGGGAPRQTATQSVNAASTPTDSQNSGPTYHFAGIEPQKQYSGRDLVAAIQDAIDHGAPLSLRGAR